MKVRTFKLQQFIDGRASSPFANGLRPKEELGYEPQFLEDADNAYLMGNGCFNAEKFARTFSLNETAQIFATFKGIFVLTEDKAYSYINQQLNNLLGFYGIGNYGSGAYGEGDATVQKGGMWTLADFGEYILFTNSEVNLIRDPETGAINSDDGTVFPISNAICSHRGRLILGGMRNYPEASKIYSNWVAWSDINNLSFISPENIRQARQNLSGYMPMPWEGLVLRVVPLDNNVIVYGDNGITAMKLEGSTYGQEPVHEVGIAGQGAIITNGRNDRSSIHYFVDKSGWLYKMDRDLQPNRLGYKEFFK